MPTDIRDCGFLLSKVKLYYFQGSIQLRVVKMASVLGCSSNALLAETGAKRFIKKNVNTQTTSEQTIGHQCKGTAGATSRSFAQYTQIAIVDSTNN